MCSKNGDASIPKKKFTGIFRGENDEEVDHLKDGKSLDRGRRKKRQKE
jgi:hypothetical protein